MELPLLKIRTKLPPFKTFEKNGCRVYHMPVRTLPLFESTILLRTGGMEDPFELAGLTSLTIAMLKKGTKNRTLEQLDFEIELHGMQIHSQTHSDRILISLDGLKSSFEKGIELLQDILRNPVFPEKEFEKVKEKRLYSIKRKLDDPSRLASKAYMQELFELKEFGYPVSGTMDSIQKIQIHHVKERYETLFTEIPRTYFYVGDLNKDEIQYCSELLGQHQSVKHLQGQATHSHENRFKLIIVHKPDASQVQIRAGVHTVSHLHPDYYKLLLGSAVLGGSFSSRLMQKIRVEKGYSYGAYASMQAMDHEHSIFSFQTFTRPENVQEVLDIFSTEIQKLKQERIPDDELIMTKNYISGQYPLSFEQIHDLTGKLLKIELFHFSVEEIENFPLKLLDISSEEIRESFIRHIPTEDFTIVLVGQKDEILKSLKPTWKSQAIIKDGMEIVNPKRS
jgi:zinc protease